jgi:hypothetical protein
MNKKSKTIIILCVLLVFVVALIIGLFLLLPQMLDKSDPVSQTYTDGWTYEYELSTATLWGTSPDGETTKVFTGDMGSTELTFDVSPEKVYVLYANKLYSIDADGNNLHQIANKCFNSLCYYDGYIYTLELHGGGKSSDDLAKLVRFQAGTNQKDTYDISVLEFSIADDRITIRTPKDTSEYSTGTYDLESLLADTLES